VVLSSIQSIRKLTKAAQRNSSLNFFVFFLFNAFHIGFLVYLTAGVPGNLQLTKGSGSLGIVNGLTSNPMTSSKQQAVAVCSVLSIVLCLITVLRHMYLYKLMLRAYKSGGLTIQAARSEAALQVAQSSSGGYVRSTNGNFN
jgi:secretory carrier-associated membrane protein